MYGNRTTILFDCTNRHSDDTVGQNNSTIEQYKSAMGYFFRAKVHYDDAVWHIDGKMGCCNATK